MKASSSSRAASTSCRPTPSARRWARSRARSAALLLYCPSSSHSSSSKCSGPCRISSDACCWDLRALAKRSFTTWRLPLRAALELPFVCLLASSSSSTAASAAARLWRSSRATEARDRRAASAEASSRLRSRARARSSDALERPSNNTASRSGMETWSCSCRSVLRCFVWLRASLRHHSPKLVRWACAALSSCRNRSEGRLPGCAPA
mmetsp:Transcript_28556/g.81744  ORF Transcript_28556/g.81744 Transcript_28556/m.81744 type:complete len:207 (+) Transcript_28556:170-790(+)